jgi:hypothetical protein
MFLEQKREAMPDAEVRYGTFLRASLLGIGSYTGPRDGVFSVSMFPRMFKRVVKDMLQDGGEWVSRVCDRVCTETSPSKMTYNEAEGIMDHLRNELGAFAGTKGAVGVLCMKVLCGALVRTASARHTTYVADFVDAALPTADRLHTFAASVPGFLEQPVSLRGTWLGTQIAATCLVDLVRGISVTRSRELLDALFEMQNGAIVAFAAAVNVEIDVFTLCGTDVSDEQVTRRTAIRDASRAALAAKCA